MSLQPMWSFGTAERLLQRDLAEVVLLLRIVKRIQQLLGIPWGDSYNYVMI